MSGCKYCGKEEKLTREHIVPAYMYDFQKRLETKVIGWNEVAKKMVGGELKIKDVCAECNNGVLSELDDYSKIFLEKSGLFVQNYIKNQISFTYNYDFLLRWLLKVSFNSSRTSGEQKHLFEKHIPYILSGSNSPKKNQVSLVAQMVAPEILNNSYLEKKKFLELSGGSNILNPFLIRICYGEVNGSIGYTLRMIIIGPVIFYLLMFDNDILPGHAATEVKRIIKKEPNSVFLSIKNKHATIRSGQKSWVELYQHQVERAKHHS